LKMKTKTQSCCSVVIAAMDLRPSEFNLDARNVSMYIAMIVPAEKKKEAEAPNGVGSMNLTT